MNAVLGEGPVKVNSNVNLSNRRSIPEPELITT